MSSDAFFTTRWTRVARSRGNSEEAKLALSELCEAYYDPVHGFIRVTVRDNVLDDLGLEQLGGQGRGSHRQGGQGQGSTLCGT